MPTPEEDQREREQAVALLGSIAGLDDRLRLLDPGAKTTDWAVLDRGRDSIGSQSYELVNGKVSLGFRLMEAQDYLSWYSDRPGFLKIGDSMENYLDFLEFSLETLPDMLFDLDAGGNTDYAQGSTAVLKYRTLRKDTRFSLDSERERIKLISELVTSPKAHESLAVLGARPDGVNPYVFIVTFGSRTPASYLSIGVSSGVIPSVAWNPDVSSWALGTHIDRDKLGDIATTSAKLSAQIAQIKSPAVGS